MKTKPHILVIDDENHICESCDRIFSSAGYRVDTNINASKGFRQALLNPYDAIILDLNLIESDGMKLLYGIRKRKPYVPVVIITGYPSEESRKKSSEMGVLDYITKPFEPTELLEPVQRIIRNRTEPEFEHKDLAEVEIRKANYHFYQTSWFCCMKNNIVRVGGYLPNLSDATIESIRLPELGSMVYRGLPLAEVTLSNGTQQVIPAPVSGKVIILNDQLRDHFYNLEKNLHRKSWIAVVEPDDIDQDLRASQIRKVLVFADHGTEENEFYQRIQQKGYTTRITGNIGEVMNLLSSEKIPVLITDAKNFGESGPEYIQRINQGFPGTKIIVFNDPDINMEKRYRRNNLFYYGVNQISNNEMIDILHCSFVDAHETIELRNPRVSRFMPNTISKISITNTLGIRVTLLAYNDILQHKSGLGYILTKELLDRSYPLEIHHSRSGRSMEEDSVSSQVLAYEKEKNDRIILLQSMEMDKIPGSITKDYQEYRNKRSTLNLLVKISIQPCPGKSGKVEFDTNTILAFKEIILKEMTSK
jgi:DNA-binding response OmpR family regulator